MHCKWGVYIALVAYLEWDAILIVKWREALSLTIRSLGAFRYRGSRTRVTYFAEEGVFFKTSASPRVCKRRVLLRTQVRSMGGENALTIHEPYAALTPSDSRSDWAPDSAVAKQAENYNIKS